MNKKLNSVFWFITQIFTIASVANPKQFVISKAISKFQSELLDCDSNVLSFMNFRFNYKCVQFVRGNNDGKRSSDCTATIIQQSSHDITFYVRSMSWFFNRNIFIDESLKNANEKRNSTKSCENYLIFLDNATAMKSILEAAAIDTNVTKVLFPFSKLYFIFEDMNVTLSQSERNKISEFLYEKAHFGYVFEFHSDTKKMGLRDLLTNNYTTEPSQQQRNSIHPFVDRRNKKKQFRVRFNHCYPYVIIVDANEQR